MTEYNPFRAAFNDLECKDLVALRDATEGWYVEYKEELPIAKKIAKSISSFANSYGGWLFYGIKENRQLFTAGEFIGLSTATLDESLRRVRSAIATCINPECYYQIKVLKGPELSTDLRGDKFILCLYIPQSSSAPHIHIDGRIYRRIGEQSEPKPETDRFLLDNLFRRSEKLQSRLAHWLRRSPPAGLQTGRAVLQVFFSADVRQYPTKRMNLTLDDFRDLINDDAGVAAVVFDSVYTSSTGFVARQSVDQNFSASNILWRVDHTLESEAVIPIQSYDFTGPIPHRMNRCSQGQRFTDLLVKKNCSNRPVIDLNVLFPCLLGLTAAWRRLLRKANCELSFYAKMRVVCAPGTIPFLDDPCVLGHYEAYGMPIWMETRALVPPGTDADSFINVPGYTEFASEVQALIAQVGEILVPLFASLGLPMYWDQREGRKNFLHALYDAGQQYVQPPG